MRHLSGYHVAGYLVAVSCRGRRNINSRFFAVTGEFHGLGSGVGIKNSRIQIEVHADIAAEGDGVLREDFDGSRLGSGGYDVDRCAACGTCKVYNIGVHGHIVAKSIIGTGFTA